MLVVVAGRPFLAHFVLVADSPEGLVIFRVLDRFRVLVVPGCLADDRVEQKASTMPSL